MDPGWCIWTTVCLLKEGFCFFLLVCLFCCCCLFAMSVSISMNVHLVYAWCQEI